MIRQSIYTQNFISEGKLHVFRSLSPPRTSLVIWITGLSGAGKTTLANDIARLLRAAGRSVVVLDGDDLREVLTPVTFDAESHTREKRFAIAKVYSRLSLLLADQDLTVVVATISLFHEIHRWNRKNLPDYFEVYLKVPMNELQRRDPKDLYRRAETGEISNVAGIDLAVDYPLGPDWEVEYLPGKSSVSLAVELSEKLGVPRER